MGERAMKILVTGANGFVGSNLICELKVRGFDQLFLYDVATDPQLLDEYCASCDFVFHLAGVNRPKEESEFKEGNVGLTQNLLDALKNHKNPAPILFSSSIQAAFDNPYGKSKREAENLLFSYGAETGIPVFVFRLPNVFGKWCRPNYNSVVATFCHAIARDLPYIVNDSEVVLHLAYIDDVVDSFLKAMDNDVLIDGEFCIVPTIHTVKLGTIVFLLTQFRESRRTLSLPDVGNSFEKLLYSTYLSYLPENNFSYPLTMHTDERGSFTELLKTPERGQISINISKIGITKGNHYHHTKNEKFIVVEGTALIQFRKIGKDKNGKDFPVFEYPVTGEHIEVVDIPPGFTHSITNKGASDLVTVMWASESYDPDKPDTYFEKV
jgi:UDP-2-acetamido-2,6-beta-L-arabino-hexul-4-ose reductase